MRTSKYKGKIKQRSIRFGEKQWHQICQDRVIKHDDGTIILSVNELVRSVMFNTTEIE